MVTVTAMMVDPDRSVDLTIRRPQPGDEQVFIDYCAQDHLFELDPDDAEPGTPIDLATAEAFLADPTVRFWMAEHGSEPVGILHCFVLALPRDIDRTEVLLYDIGTRIDWRRRGVGRALIAAMEAWMVEQGIAEVWVGAASTAVEFYRASGFVASDDTFMDKTLAARTHRRRASEPLNTDPAR